MQLVFTGSQREAVALHRILKTDGIDAVCMTGTDHPTGAVFVPAEDAENCTAISHAIERMQRERAAEGEATANQDTHVRAVNELRWCAPELPGARCSLRSMPVGRTRASAEATSADQVLPRLSRTLQRAPTARSRCGAIALEPPEPEGRLTRRALIRVVPAQTQSGRSARGVSDHPSSDAPVPRTKGGSL